MTVRDPDRGIDHGAKRNLPLARRRSRPLPTHVDAAGHWRLPVGIERLFVAVVGTGTLARFKQLNHWVAGGTVLGQWSTRLRQGVDR